MVLLPWLGAARWEGGDSDVLLERHQHGQLELLRPLLGPPTWEDLRCEPLVECYQRWLGLDELGVHERHCHVRTCIEPLQSVHCLQHDEEEHVACSTNKRAQ